VKSKTKVREEMRVHVFPARREGAMDLHSERRYAKHMLVGTPKHWTPEGQIELSSVQILGFTSYQTRYSADCCWKGEHEARTSDASSSSSDGTLSKQQGSTTKQD
jgi:hypothetical protein